MCAECDSVPKYFAILVGITLRGRRACTQKGLSDPPLRIVKQGRAKLISEGTCVYLQIEGRVKVIVFIQLLGIIKEKK